MLDPAYDFADATIDILVYFLIDVLLVKLVMVNLLIPVSFNARPTLVQAVPVKPATFWLTSVLHVVITAWPNSKYEDEDDSDDIA